VTEEKKAGLLLELSGDWLRTALSTTPVSIWEQDRHLRYRAVCNWLLDRSEEEIVGQRDVEVMPRREDGEHLEALKRRVLESGVAAQHEVAVANGEGDEQRFFEITIEPLYTEAGEVSGVVGVTYDITARKAAELEHEKLLATVRQERARLQEMTDNLEQRIEEGTQQIRALASDLTLAEQRERRRIAQVLHDELQQILVAVQMGLHMTVRDLEQKNGNALRRLNELNDHVIEAFDVTRTLTATLDSPGMNSELLADAFAWLAALMRDRYELSVQLDMEDDCRLPNQDLRELIVSLTRELLFNVVKHAQVDEAALCLRSDEEWIYIHIEDQGVGFDPLEGLTAHASGGGFGLYSVRERLELFGGSLNIDSAPGAGTHITLAVPRHDTFYPHE
jgi:PAS domain S-box-containing protein